MKTRKRIRLAALAAALASGWTGVCHAVPVNPDSLTLTVTIGNQVSVRIKDAAGSDLNTYDFGQVLLGQVSVNTGTINIDNDSGGLTETLQLSVGDNPGNGLVLRTDANALGLNEYRLSALFQDASPPPGLFGSDDILTASPQTAQDASGGRFVAGGTPATQDGAAVPDDNRLGSPPGAEVRLWIKLELAGMATLNGSQANFATVFVSAI
jgi:hypothetical protein